MALTNTWKARCDGKSYDGKACGMYRFVEGPSDAVVLEALKALGWDVVEWRCAKCVEVSKGPPPPISAL